MIYNPVPSLQDLHLSHKVLDPVCHCDELLKLAQAQVIYSPCSMKKVTSSGGIQGEIH